MKKLIDDPRITVSDLLDGLVASDPGIVRLDGETVVVRSDISDLPDQRPVAIISGGGSGHEPAHAGFVGPGMLSAAVAGDVFTSPSVDAVFAAILATAGPAGALLIVKNYTGDRLNFSLAAEMARDKSIPVEVVFVADDVALGERVSRDRRRGIAGTVLVHKVAGAAAARDIPLHEIAKKARATAEAVASMGVGLGSCIVPSAGKPGFDLGAEEIEFGLGIHGEKGAERSAMLPARDIVERLLETILADLGPAAQGPVGLLVNGLGGTPPMELAIVARHALAVLAERGATPELVWTGTFMSALEMPGCSLSVVALTAERKDLLCAPTAVRIWPSTADVGGSRSVAVPRSDTQVPEAAAGPLTPALRKATTAIAEAMIAAEARLTELDAKSGDGDLGASMYRGAQALKALPDGAYNTPRLFLSTLAEALRRAIAGSSGPFYASALMRAANALPETDQPKPEDWDRAVAAGIAAVSEIGGAQPGDRTMVDALAPALEAWNAARRSGMPPQEAIVEAASAARTGAKATAEMSPKLGRAAYLGDRALGHPDGGAVAVAIWLAALSGQDAPVAAAT